MLLQQGRARGGRDGDPDFQFPPRRECFFNILGEPAQGGDFCCFQFPPRRECFFNGHISDFAVRFLYFQFPPRRECFFNERHSVLAVQAQCFQFPPRRECFFNPFIVQMRKRPDFAFSSLLVGNASSTRRRTHGAFLLDLFQFPPRRECFFNKTSPTSAQNPTPFSSLLVGNASSTLRSRLSARCPGRLSVPSS